MFNLIWGPMLVKQPALLSYLKLKLQVPNEDE